MQTSYSKILKNIWFSRLKTKNNYYKRISNNSFNLDCGLTWDLNDIYMIKSRTKIKKIKDKGTLRAFTKDELAIFLTINGFTVEKFISGGYMNEPYSFITIARKS